MKYNVAIINLPYFAVTQFVFIIVSIVMQLFSKTTLWQYVFM